MFPSERADKMMIRLPDGMRDRIRDKAKANRRTMNSEVVHYIDRALAAENKKGPAEGATSPSHDQNHTTQMENGNDA